MVSHFPSQTGKPPQIGMFLCKIEKSGIVVMTLVDPIQFGSIKESMDMFIVLGGGLVIILIAVVIAVVSSVVSAIAADQSETEK